MSRPSGHTPAEWAAKARLEQAAPDLLEAAKAAQRFIVNGIELGYITMPDPDSGDPALIVPVMLRQAIAKAERGAS